MTKRDVVIVGGSLAGAACARELARRNIDAIALERDRFPRRKVCGGFLSPGAIDCLQRLGLLEEVRRAGAVTVTSAHVCAGNVGVDIPFSRHGLGISRFKLDAIAAGTELVRQQCAVTGIRREREAFVVTGPSVELECRVVVDAAGKLSRFTPADHSEQFGVQYELPGQLSPVLQFQFFDGGYGGSVAVEDGRTNHCFLIGKERLRAYLSRDCMVTGPVAYKRRAGDYIAIGDAAGMIDPFCGDGMRHALDTGILAAAVIARGLREGRPYSDIRRLYHSEWRRNWQHRRALAAMARCIMRQPWLFRAVLRTFSQRFLDRVWA